MKPSQCIRYFGIGVVICLTAYWAYNHYLNTRPVFNPVITATDGIKDIQAEKMNIEHTLITALKLKKELITYEGQLSELVSWDESWGDLDVFHKSQKIKFYGTGIYVCDLDKLTKDDILVNIDSKTIEVTVPKPYIKSITIDESKTEYEDVEKGWLRFGEIKLTSQQYNSMQESVKKAMEAQLNKEQIYTNAKDSTVSSVKELFEEVLKAVDDDFTVRVIIL